MKYIKALNFNFQYYSHVYRTLTKAVPIIQELGYEICSEAKNPDYTIISNKDFVFPELSLDESIEKGIELVKQYDNVILYDATDSTSLQGIIEILDNCDNVKCLVKHQILDREAYKETSPFGRWFFKGLGHDDICPYSYDISEKLYDKIHLSGLNIFYWLAPLSLKDNGFRYCSQNLNKEYGIFNVSGLIPKPKSRFGFDDGILYNAHRKNANKIIEKFKYHLSEKLPYQEYLQKLSKSIISFSPYGMGELCLRDVESWICGTCLIKPDIRNIKTVPNIWNNKDMVTTWTCKQDLEDLEQQIEFLTEYKIVRDSLISNAFEAINKNYVPEILTQWKKILT